MLPGRSGADAEATRVLATLNGVSFETFIVPRQQTFFMLVDEDIKQAAQVAVGEIVEITVALAAVAKERGGFIFWGFRPSRRFLKPDLD